MTAPRTMNAGSAVEAAQVEALREAMIAESRELKAIRSDRVAEAFRSVPHTCRTKRGTSGGGSDR
ncbi:MAG: hypothetical protein ACRDRX_02270 [Pseudonocardiaceae bacterium]